MQRNLPLVTEDNIADLLHVVCNSRFGTAPVMRLLEEAIKLKVFDGTTSNQQHLVYNLLQTCLVRGHEHAALELLESRAAQGLGKCCFCGKSVLQFCHKEWQCPPG